MKWNRCLSASTSEATSSTSSLSNPETLAGCRSSLSDSNSDATGWSSMPNDIQLKILGNLIPPPHPVRGWDTRDLLALASTSKLHRQSVHMHLAELPHDLEARMHVFPSSLTKAGPSQGPTVRCVLEQRGAFIHLYMQGSEGKDGAHGKRLLTAKRYIPLSGSTFVIGLHARKLDIAGRSALGKVVSVSSKATFSMLSLKELPKHKFRILEKEEGKKMESVGVVTRSPSCNPKIFANLIEPKNAKSGEAQGRPVFLELGTHEVWMPQESAPAEVGGVREMWSSLQSSFLRRKVDMEELYEHLDSDVTGEGDGWKKIIEISEEDHDVVIQVVKVGKNVFHLEYKAPMSALLAFAVALGSLDALQVKAKKRLM